MSTITICCDNSALQDNIKTLLTHYGFDALCQITNDKADPTQSAIQIGDAPCPKTAKIHPLPTPLRIGALLDLIETLAREAEDKRSFAIGPYTLKAAENKLDGPQMIKLTDTEKRILILLAQQKGQAVSRDQLLSEVWGYRPDLDTHTVETHIYRLRQKIESDPSSPRILLTDHEGYALA